MVEKVKYYLSLNYPMITTWEPDDEIYVVEFPDLPGCMAHGKTPNSAVKLAEAVKKDWIIESLSRGNTIPEPKKAEDFSGKFIVRIDPALHKRLSEQSEREGKSLNQHVYNLLSERSAALCVENSIERLVEKVASKIDHIPNQKICIIPSSAVAPVASVYQESFASKSPTQDIFKTLVGETATRVSTFGIDSECIAV